MDFTKYGLEGEQLAQAEADYTEDVAGLKNKNTEAHEKTGRVRVEFDEFKASIKNNEVEIEQAKHDSAILLAEKNGSIEEYKKALQDKEDAMALMTSEHNAANDSRTLADSVNDFSSVLADDPAGKMFMRSQFEEQVHIVDGSVVAKDTTKSLDDVKLGLVSDKANARYIRAEVGAGGGSAGPGGNNGGSVVNEQAVKAQKGNDLGAYLRASM